MAVDHPSHGEKTIEAGTRPPALAQQVQSTLPQQPPRSSAPPRQSSCYLSTRNIRGAKNSLLFYLGAARKAWYATSTLLKSYLS